MFHHIDAINQITERKNQFAQANPDITLIKEGQQKHKSILFNYGLIYDQNQKRYFKCFASEDCANHSAIILSSKSTGNGLRHLHEVHGWKTEELIGSSPPQSLEQRTNSEGISMERYLELQVCRLVVKKMLPFNSFDDLEFRSLLHPLTPVTPPERIQCILVDYFNTWFNLVIKPLLNNLFTSSPLPSMNILIDDYNHKLSGQRYLGIRVIFLDLNFKLHSYLLTIAPYEPSLLVRMNLQANQLIKNAIELIFKDYGIVTSKINSISSDYGSDVYTAARKLSTYHVWCFSHFFNRVLKDSVGEDAPGAVIVLLRQMKEAIKGNANISWKNLKNVEMLLAFEENGRFTNSVENIWQTTASAFQTIIIEFTTLTSTLPCPIAGKLVEMIQIYSIIKPIACMIKTIQESTNFSPLIKLLRMLKSLRKSVIYDHLKPLTIIDAKNHDKEGEKIPYARLQQISKDVLNAMKEAIEEKFFQRVYFADHQSRIMDVVMYFHPKYRLSHLESFCSDEIKRNQIRAKVIAIIQEKLEMVWKHLQPVQTTIPSRSSSSSSSNNKNVSNNKKRTFALLSCDSEEEAEGDEQIDEENDNNDIDAHVKMINNIHQEKADYESLVIQDDLSDENLLLWWKSQKEKFPLLSEVARSVLATPGSSGTLERDFSAGAIAVDRLRTRLSSSLFGLNMLLRINYHSLPRPGLVSNSVTLTNLKTSIIEHIVDPFRLFNDQIDIQMDEED